jgi:predicted RNase H-like HicB family nuclease
MSKITVVIEKDEDGFFVASVPSIPGCYTQAKTMPELMRRIKEAILVCADEITNTQFIDVRQIDIKA